ncbi:M28 family peptidase [Actinoplanes sp. NEAU-A12]|uniref:M28 family peptidase n=1 Tax=Actinoplanes sandaracinus TaxID=3045177 RepID=A0ABT6WGX2_9ACTN|nr:M28 family peptidase [Actinoplanes sandaracinus]MDI6098965.1 M28 family peptidase [Actinoplanes sandaracinus]
MLGLGAAYTAGYPGTGQIPEPDFSDGGAVSSAAAADQYVTGTSTGFTKDPDATYTRQSVITTPRGLNYVSYSRTYNDLPVFVGGDVVVVTDAKGTVKGSSVPADEVDVATTPKVGAAKAKSVALGKHQGTVRQEPTLGVIAEGKDRLVWEVVVDSETSRAHAYVDARTGQYAGSWDEITGGTGQGHYGGQVTIGTTSGAGGFEMRDPARGGMRTLDDRTGKVLADTDDKWGNGAGGDLPTGGVDTQYAGGVMWDMLKTKFNRNGIDGKGGTASMFVGLNDVNAFYSCAGTGDANRDQTKYGRTSDGARQVNSVDVVAHELGHGVFCHTPGGSRGTTNETGGLNEATGDIFGTLAEHFAANPNDPADYLVGEEVNLSGRGPIRNMHNPSAVGDPNCWSASIPNTEVHSAAGPLNHWFYLTAEGSAPAGKPASTTCNGSRVTGIGLWPAGEIFYHALLRKTSGWTYTKARKATLEAARELYPNSCAEFAVVKAAWDAVSVPAQGDPTCTVTAPQPSPSVTQPSAPVSPSASASAPASPSTAPSPSAPGSSAPGTPTVRAADIDGAALRADLAEFARIAQANGGNRAHGTAGYQASLDYLKKRLDTAGYNTRVQQFTHAGKTGYNLIADLPGRGDPNRVVMLGAHLDSVAEGPGINDNATGSAGILEVALAYAASGANGDKGIRFGWWGAEEDGLIGSKAYVASLSAAERAKVTAYLNFDMIGSPNPGYFVYGDDTRGTAIAAALRSGFTAEGVEPESADLKGRSDHASFKAAGIPTGGTATLSLAPTMSPAQAARWDGQAGQPFDPCYHKDCDGAGNVDHDALDTHADVAAHAVWALTGVKAPAQPAGTRVENPADFAIRDRSAVESPITVQRSGKAPAALKVDVNVRHGFRGDLEIHLIAPDGTEYSIKKANRFDGDDDVKQSSTVDASAEQASGTWKLRVRDLYRGDTGTLDSWALTF